MAKNSDWLKRRNGRMYAMQYGYTNSLFSPTPSHCTAHFYPLCMHSRGLSNWFCLSMCTEISKKTKHSHTCHLLCYSVAHCSLCILMHFPSCQSNRNIQRTPKVIARQLAFLSSNSAYFLFWLIRLNCNPLPHTALAAGGMCTQCTNSGFF